MQNSKRRNKKHKQILVLALGFVACATILNGCSVQSKKKKDKEYKFIDVSDHYEEFVEVRESANLFVKEESKYKKVGKVEIGSVMKLEPKDAQDMQDPHFKLKGENTYVDAFKVKRSQPIVQEKIKYLPFQENLNTKDNYALYDENDKIVYEFTQGSSYPIYIKDNDRFGVVMQDRIYYIHSSDIKDFSEQVNTVEEAASNIPVLMYHAFYDKMQPPANLNGNYVGKDEFNEQLKYLKEHHYETLNMKELDLYMDGKVRLKKNSIALTSDDGYENVYTIAYPLLKEYDFHATVFLITSTQPETMYDYWSEARSDGVLEYQSHSKDMHKGGCSEKRGGKILCVPHDEGVLDTQESLNYVGNGFVYCYPFGDFNDHAQQILKDANVRMAFTTQYGKIEPGMNKLILPRVRVFGGAGIDRFIKNITD